VFLTYAGPISAVGLVAGHAVTWLDLVALMYGVYYMVIEQPGLAGPIASVMILGCWYSAQYAKLAVGADALWQPCVGKFGFTFTVVSFAIFLYILCLCMIVSTRLFVHCCF